MVNFKDDDLINLYKIVKEYCEALPDDMDEWYQEHSDFDDEPIEKKDIVLLLEKIGNALFKDEGIEIDKDFLRKQYHHYNHDVDERVYEIVSKGFRDLKGVEIGYFDMGKGEFVKRIIDVYYKSKRYVVGFCHLRKAMRKFRTSRIGVAKLTKNKYKIPKGFDKNDY